MFGCDAREDEVAEEVVLAFRERTPGFDLYAVLTHEVLVGGALEEGMGLYLVDGRDHLVVLNEVDEPVRIEVRDANGLRQALSVGLLQRAPGAVVVTERLMNEEEIDVVKAQALKRPLDGTSRAVLAGLLLDEEFGGNE